MLAIAAGLVIGVLAIPFTEKARRRRAAEIIQRRWLMKSRVSRRYGSWNERVLRRSRWRNRDDPTSVMGRTTAWDNAYYHDYYGFTTNWSDYY
eukprot:scaffold25369_cov35-Phaeocystis_antarctica.AAC.3